MTKRVLFLGEGELSGPARYLAGVLKHAHLPFDHRTDRAKLPKRWRQKRYDIAILSDYRYASWTPCARKWLTRQVSEEGMGLLMIGGWASFTGRVGAYAGTDVERLLPVRCIPGDDRVQKATGALFLPQGHHPRKGSVPMVCGYHRAQPKPGTRVTHIFRDLVYRNGRVALGPSRPALVLGHAGRARTAAFLTDCAPHWAGGLVDWGDRTLITRVAAGVEVQIGNNYVRFFKELISWVAGWKEDFLTSA